MGCFLAPEYPLSEPRALGPLHSVLGGPSSYLPAQWVLACLADSRGRVPVRHGFVQVQRHHRWSGSTTLVPTNFPLRDSISLHLDSLQTKTPETDLKKIFKSFLYTFDVQLHCFGVRRGMLSYLPSYFSRNLRPSSHSLFFHTLWSSVTK